MPTTGDSSVADFSASTANNADTRGILEIFHAAHHWAGALIRHTRVAPHDIELVPSPLFEACPPSPPNPLPPSLFAGPLIETASTGGLRKQHKLAERGEEQKESAGVSQERSCQ